MINTHVIILCDFAFHKINTGINIVVGLSSVGAGRTHRDICKEVRIHYILARVNSISKPTHRIFFMNRNSFIQVYTKYFKRISRKQEISFYSRDDDCISLLKKDRRLFNMNINKFSSIFERPRLRYQKEYIIREMLTVLHHTKKHNCIQYNKIINSFMYTYTHSLFPF